VFRLKQCRYQLPLISRVLSPPAKNLSPEQVSQRQAAAAAALEHQANLAKHGIQGSTTDFKWLADVLKKVWTLALFMSPLPAALALPRAHFRHATCGTR
jgi:hypothetical protein